MLVIKFKHHWDLMDFIKEKMPLCCSPNTYYWYASRYSYYLIIPDKDFLDNGVYEQDYKKYSIEETYITNKAELICCKGVK